MEDFVAEFREEAYLPLLRQLAEDTAKWLADEEEVTAKKFAEDVEREIRCVAELQEQGLMPVTELLLSLTYTSVYFGRPQIRLDFYAEPWMISEPVYSASIDASWLFVFWERHLTDLADAAKCLRARVRATHLESMRAQSVRMLGYLFSSRVKYWIRRIRGGSAFAALQTGAEFYLSFGEYMDWQKAIFARLPEADIFQCGTEDSLRFRDFFQCCYQEKSFAEVDLSGSRFVGCVFARCTFTAADLCDTVFEHCRFVDTVLTDGAMSGAQFADTLLRGVVLRRMEASPSALCGGRQELYRELLFAGCTLENVTLEQCRLPGAVLAECLYDGVRLEDCDCRDSDFAVFAAGEQGEGL